MYSFPYLIISLLFLLLFFIEYKIPNSRKKVSYASALIFMFFFGFRGLIGSDWYNYQIEYEYISWNNLYISNLEEGFNLMIKVSKDLSLNYNQFITVITLIQTILLKIIFERYAKYISFSYFILIALFPIVVIDLLRNFTAILIVVTGLYYLEKDNIKKFLIFIFFGTLFHLTSIVFILLIFIRKKNFSKIFLLIFFIAGIVVYLLQINFYKPILEYLMTLLGGRFEVLIGQSTGKEEIAYGISLGILEKIALFIFVYLNSKKLQKLSPLFINMFFVYILIYLYFSTSQTFINRFSNLFMFGYILVSTHIIFETFQFYKLKVILSLFICFLLLRTYLGYNNILYEYSNNLLSKDNEVARQANRIFYYQNRDL